MITQNSHHSHYGDTCYMIIAKIFDSHYGICDPSDNIRLHGLLLIPRIKFNLISVAKLAIDSNMVVQLKHVQSSLTFIWHRRLGHVPFTKLQKMTRLNCKHFLTYFAMYVMKLDKLDCLSIGIISE